MRDYRDLVIEDLSADLHEAHRERDSYRELLAMTLVQLHDALAQGRQRRATVSPVPPEHGTGGLPEKQSRMGARRAA